MQDEILQNDSDISVLQTNLSTETSNRISGDSSLQTQIDSIQADQLIQDDATALVQTNLDNHATDTNNPHNVTLEQSILENNSAGSNQIKNVSEPTDNQDVATKNYVLDRVLVINTTDSTTNINQGTTYVPIPVFGTTVSLNDVGDFTTINSEQIQFNFDGWVEINSNILYTSNGQRVSLQSKFTLDNVEVGSTGSTGYIRASNNHNESSLHHSGNYVQVTDGSVLRYVTRRESTAAQNATMLPEGCQISIRKIKI